MQNKFTSQLKQFARVGRVFPKTSTLKNSIAALPFKGKSKQSLIK